MKVGVVGAGFVGAASAYAMAIRGSASDIVIIDVNKAKAEAEARDIAHATTFTHPVRVSSGDFADLAGAKVVIMSAGVNQKPGETRLQLLGRNGAIFRSVIPQIVANAPGAIILVSANDGLLDDTKTPRREGLDMVLDPVRAEVSERFLEHIDGLQSRHLGPGHPKRSDEDDSEHS